MHIVENVSVSYCHEVDIMRCWSFRWVSNVAISQCSMRFEYFCCYTCYINWCVGWIVNMEFPVSQEWEAYVLDVLRMICSNKFSTWNTTVACDIVLKHTQCILGWWFYSNLFWHPFIFLATDVNYSPYYVHSAQITAWWVRCLEDSIHGMEFSQLTFLHYHIQKIKINSKRLMCTPLSTV